MKNQEYELFVCDCHNVDHNFIVTYEDEYKEIYISVKVNKLPFWQRIFHGLSYIFGYDHGYYDEVILDIDQIKVLKNKLSEHLEKWSTDDADG